MLVAANMGYT
ncbi:Protein of unknown function [Bacillus wiedmannii]|nr:Protein of unknown function [Bacillus wiedmannii]